MFVCALSGEFPNLFNLNSFYVPNMIEFPSKGSLINVIAIGYDGFAYESEK